MPRYELSDGSSNKFWDIQVDGSAFTTTYGKIGSSGQATTKEFGSAAEAKVAADKLVAEKVKKGYAKVAGGAAAPAAAPVKSAKKVANSAAPAAKKTAAPAAKKTAAPAAKSSASSASGADGARYFEFVDGKSSKFWEIITSDTSVSTRYGKIGASGQETEKDFDSASEAFKEAEKLVAEKTKKGYVEIATGAAAAVADARNPELEAAIAADPEDSAAYSVLADWLQEQGDPRGELIALELAGKDKPAAAFLAKNQDVFLGPLAEHQKTYDGEDTAAFTWKLGYIHGLRLSHDHYSDSDFEGPLAKVLDLVLRHPSGRFLSEITFVFNNDPNEDNLQDLIDMLAKRAPATLRKLHFGDFEYCGPSDDTATGNTEISWYSIGDVSKLWKAVPNLRTLITQCGSSESAISGIGVKLGTIDLPELRHAEFRSGGLEKFNVKSIVTAKIPNIERLDIWFGDESYGGDSTVKDVLPLLARTDLPKLRRLGLKNALFTDELPAALATSKLVKQLEVLDLSMGCLTDDGAKTMVERAASFAHLKTIDVNENNLTDVGLDALRKAFRNVVSAEQREVDDPEYRSPAVAE